MAAAQLPVSWRRSLVDAAGWCSPLRAGRCLRWPALRAGTEDGQVANIGLEAKLRIQGPDQGSDSRRVELDDRAATAADEVDMVGVGGQVIPVRTVPEMRVRDQADLLEQLKGSVDGGEIDSDCRLLDLGVDLLGSSVLEPRDGLEDELALRGNPVTAGPQRVIPRLRHTADSSEVRITDLPVDANVS